MSVKGSHTTATYVEWDIMLEIIRDLEKQDNYRDALLIGIGIYTGLRIGDILRLRWEHVLDLQELVRIEHKTKKRRVIPINDNLHDLILRAYPKLNPWNDHYFIFHRLRNFKKTIPLISVNRYIKEACLAHGVEGNISSHTLRKTFGRKIWENNGKSAEALVMLSEIFNHQDLSVTRRYLGIRQAELGSLYLNL